MNVYDIKNYAHCYNGKFNNELTGKGIFKLPNGDTHEGSFLQGEPYGNGKNTHVSSGIIRDGNFMNGILNGLGKKIYPDGTIHSGSFSNDKKNGRCIVYPINGEIFESEFIDDVPIGKYKLTHLTGIIYEGYAVNNNYSDECTLTFNSDIHMGGFANSYYNIGKIIYTGCLKNSLFHGHGKFNIGEFIFTGAFENGYIIGDGIMTRPNGKVIKGESHSIFTKLIKEYRKNDIKMASVSRDKMVKYKKTCIGCRKSDTHKLKKCAACLMARYCGIECQYLDWSQHKHECSHSSAI
jgi:hypothetical protein